MYGYERLFRAYVRLCTAMHGYVALFRLCTAAMQAYVRLCKAMKSLCTATYGYVRPCIAIHGMVRLFKAM